MVRFIVNTLNVVKYNVFVNGWAALIGLLVKTMIVARSSVYLFAHKFIKFKQTTIVKSRISNIIKQGYITLKNSLNVPVKVLVYAYKYFHFKQKTVLLTNLILYAVDTFSILKTKIIVAVNVILVWSKEIRITTGIALNSRVRDVTAIKYIYINDKRLIRNSIGYWYPFTLKSMYNKTNKQLAARIRNVTFGLRTNIEFQV